MVWMPWHSCSYYPEGGRAEASLALVLVLVLLLQLFLLLLLQRRRLHLWRHRLSQQCDERQWR